MFSLLTIFFILLMFGVFGKILVFAIKAAWGISKIVVSVVVLPIFLIALVIGGLLKIAFPLLIIIGIAAIVVPKMAK